MNSLRLFLLVALLFSVSGLAHANRVTLIFNEYFSNYDEINIKHEIRFQTHCNPDNYDLKQIEVSGDSFGPRYGEVALEVGYIRSSFRELDNGQIQIKNPNDISDGDWILLTRGRGKIIRIVVYLK